MSIQESTRRKERNSIFHLRSGLCPALMVIIFALGAMFCIFRWSSSFEVSAAQNSNAGGDPNHGREIFEKRCTGCHALDNEKEGPRLRGVFGRKAGSISSFKYSDAVKSANVTWDADSLEKWLTDPDKFIPDSDMDFHLAKAVERSDVIAYLRQLSNP
jgi:cytochrome c